MPLAAWKVTPETMVRVAGLVIMSAKDQQKDRPSQESLGLPKALILSCFVDGFAVVEGETAVDIVVKWGMVMVTVLIPDHEG